MENYIGEIRMFAGNFAPQDWALCNGSLLPIAQNEALFTLLGTTYGGDGVTTFQLPDLRSRVPVHVGNGTGIPNVVAGQTGGTENVTLTVANLPAHSHTINGVNATGTSGNPAGLSPATPDTAGKNAYITTPAANMVQMANSSILPAGNGLPVPVMQPYVTINFIIALYGIFPSFS